MSSKDIILASAGLSTISYDTTVVFGTTSGGEAYRWSDIAGYGPKLTSTTGIGSVKGMSMHPSNNAAAFSRSSSPFISAAPFNKLTGFGTSFSNPSVLPNATLVSGRGGPSFNPSGNAIALAHNTSFASAYEWTSSGFGTKYATMTDEASVGSYDCEFSPPGNYIVFTKPNSPRLSAWPWNPGFGSKLGSYPTIPSSGTNPSVAFSNSGSFVAIAGGGSPFIHVFYWNPGFGSKISDPSTLPLASATNVIFGSSDQYIAVTYATSPYVSVYPWSGSGFGTKYADPSIVPLSGSGVAFNATNTVISVNSSMYAWSSSGFGTKYSNPSVAVSGTVLDIKFIGD